MMMNNNLNPIYAECPLEAWARIFLKVMKQGGKKLPATMVSIRYPTFEKVESFHPLMDELNRLLIDSGKQPIRTSAGIIFPYSQWRLKGWNISELSRWYLEEFMPKLIAISRKNSKTYFNRLINYTGVKQAGDEIKIERINQLEKVIDLCKAAASRETPGHFRESGLQMSLLDPVKDLTASAQSNFPCLHQIGLSFDDNGGLQLSAFYPTQFVVDRAMGNYLGLCQLGLFIASELNIQFSEFVCFIGTPDIGSFNKTPLRDLENSANQYIEDVENKKLTATS